ncbi:MAG: HNH endonuclease, partial [Methylococcaceae bacterium]|nr:HNH endonuclease [Methylococcaceae bacterium]
YDRSTAARQVCIEHHGYNCIVCGFNFAAIYGAFGANYIEVHHLKQLADISEEYQIDPIKDLRPVCANCHRMLHKERPPISIEELQRKIHDQKFSPSIYH